MDDIIFGKSQVDNPEKWTQKDPISSHAMLADVRADLRKMIDDVSENCRYNDGMGIASKLKNIENKLQKISEHFS